MAINIISADQPLQVNAIITYIYADPGLGKTSMGFTADKAVSFDFDKGAHRTGELRRGAVIPVQKWTDIANLTPNDLAPFNTVVIDTVGAMLECIKSHLLMDLETTKTPEEANSLVSQTMTWTKEQREPLLRAISRRLQHFQNPQAKENPSISVQIQNATDLTTLDSLEIDVSSLDPIIQPDMMRLITTRRLQLENAANDGGHAS